MKRWDQRIEEARQRHVLGFIPYPRFTADERELASNWATCAVGEVRRRYGVRMDRTFGTLGVKFYRAVLWNMVERAAELQESIENHALDKKREDWEQQRSGAPATPETLEVTLDTPALSRPGARPDEVSSRLILGEVSEGAVEAPPTLQ